MMDARHRLGACVCLIFLIPAGLRPVHADGNWAVSVYGARWSDNRFLEILQGQTALRSSYLAALAVSYEFDRWEDRLGLEFEGNLARHFVEQDHYEINLILIGRWRAFPWDSRVPTTVAFGAGPSLALGTPGLERARDDPHPSKLLNFLLAELTVGHPRQPDWSLFTRIHHRSGAGRLVGGVKGGSNFVALGVRRHF